jgi:hypothetical protein
MNEARSRVRTACLLSGKAGEKYFGVQVESAGASVPASAQLPYLRYCY